MPDLYSLHNITFEWILTLPLRPAGPRTTHLLLVCAQDPMCTLPDCSPGHSEEVVSLL